MVKSNAFVFAARINEQFDFIFADPPYDHPKFPEVADLIFNNQLLKSGGIFVLEHSGQFDYSNHPNFKELRRYGSVHFSLFNYRINGRIGHLLFLNVIKLMVLL